MPGLGEEFRAAREARSLSLSDVSEQIHIRTVYLQAIEDEEWAAIAAPVYVRGFIRTYARYLGLDGEHAVAHFNESQGHPKVRPDEPVKVLGAGVEKRPRTATTGWKPSPWLWAALAAAAALVLFVGYSYVQFQQNGAEVAATSAASTPVPIAAATADTRPRPSGKGKHGKAAPVKHTLQVHFTQASWLLVKIDGTQALEGTFPPGTVKEFSGGKKAHIRAGNAGGVDLTVNGRALGSMGKSGAVVDREIGLAAE